MKKTIKKAAVLGLSAGLVLTAVSGCSKKEKFDAEAAAVTVNDDSISAGVMNFAVRYMQAGYESIYMALGVADPFSQDMYGMGTTLGDDVKDMVSEDMTNALLAEQKMGEYEVELSDADKEKISAAASDFIAANDEEVLETLGATQEIVERYLELVTVRTMMEEQMSADVDTEVSDEEAAQRKIQYVLFTPITDEDLEAETETEAETAVEAGAEAESETAAEAGAEAESEAAADAETETESGTAAEEATEAQSASLDENDDVKTQSAEETETEDVTEAGTEAETAEAAAEVTEEAAEAVASEEETEAAQTEAEEETETETEDPETAEAKERARVRAEEMLGRLMDGEDFETVAEDMGMTASETTFGADYSITELVEATDGLADGTLVETPVETANGYYVVKVLSELDREATDTEKEMIVTQRKQDQISALYDEWTEEGTVTVHEDVMAEITFDYHLTQQTEASTEAETEAASDAETESGTEAVTEAGTEAASEVATEAGTEAASEAVTEAETDAVSEAAAEAETEAVSEAETENGDAGEVQTEE